MVGFSSHVTNNPSKPLLLPAKPLGKLERYTSLDKLDQFVGQVIKYTKDNGTTWNYYLIEKPLYGSDGSKGMTRQAFKAYGETVLWNDRKISASQVIDKDFF